MSVRMLPSHVVKRTGQGRVGPIPVPLFLSLSSLDFTGGRTLRAAHRMYPTDPSTTLKDGSDAREKQKES